MPYAGYSSRIPEILLQQGQQQANQRLQRGQNLASLIQGVGNIAAAVPGQVIEAQKADKAKKEVELAHTLAAQFRRPDGTTDFEKVLVGLRKSGAHQAADEVEKNLVAQRASDAARKKDELAARNTESEIAARNTKSGLDANEAKRNEIKFQVDQREKADTSGRLLAVRTILNGHANPESGKVEDWPTAIDAVRKIDPEAADHLLKNWNDSQKITRENADAARKNAASMLSRYTTPADYQKKRAGLSPELQALFPAVPTNRRDILKVGLTPKEELDTDLDEQKAAKQGASDDATLALTPEALALTAHQYAMTGQLPPMGMGKAGAAVRTAIINEAAKVYSGLDLPTQVAAYNANKASLGKMQAQRDAVGSFEETALKNLDVFLDAAKKVSDTGSPWLNKPLRTINERLLGSAEMSAFNTARRTVIPEFAKILNNPTLSGQLSDSARHEVEQVVSGDATLQQIIAAANVLKTDVRNRKTSLDDTITDIQKRIATPPGGKKDEPQKAPRKYYDANGNEIIK
jgi:hypothetical protein